MILEVEISYKTINNIVSSFYSCNNNIELKKKKNLKSSKRPQYLSDIFELLDCFFRARIPLFRSALHRLLIFFPDISFSYF